MKKITKLLVVILALATLIGCCFAFVACNNDDKKTITMYTESGFAPFEFVGSNNKIIGVDVAIMSQVAENLGMKLKIEDISFDFIPQYVANASNAVGAAGLSITDERKQTVDFSNVYFSSTLVIVSKSDIAYDSVADLAGLHVGVQQGTSGDNIITKAAEADGYTYLADDKGTEDESDDEYVTVHAAGANIQRYSTYSLVYADLKQDRIDAILMDKLPAQSLLKTNSDSENTFVCKDASDLLTEDFGIAIKKGDNAMMEAVNAVIDKWLENGNMEKYITYYTALDDFEKNGGDAPVAPEGLKLSWNV